MAPLPKVKNHGYAMLSNVVSLDDYRKGAHKAGSGKTDTKTPQEETTSQMTTTSMLAVYFKALMQIALNLGTDSMEFAKQQSDQASVSQAEATITHDSTQKYMQQLASFAAEQAKAHAWGIFGDVMKWVGVGLAAVVGALLCETPAGFAILALVIGLTASGLLNKGLTFVGDKLGNAMGSQTWGNIIVQAVAIVLITVATAGAEAGYAAVAATRAASTAAEATMQAAIKAGQTLVEKTITQAVEVGAEDGGGQALTTITEDASAQAENAASKASEAVDKTKFLSNLKSSLNGYAARTAGVTSLTSSNIIGELVKQMIGHIPGNSTAKEWAEAILTAVITIVVAVASFKGMTETDTFAGKFMEVGSKLRLGLFSLEGAGSAAGSSATAGTQWTNYEAGQTQKSIGPLLQQMDEGKGLTNVFNSLATVTQQTMKAMTEALQTIFSINIGAGWSTVAHSLV